MIRLSGVHLNLGQRTVLGGADLVAHAGQKVGLVGANGAGKTTLVRVVAGELAPDRGEVALPADTVIARVEQEVRATSRAALEYVLDGDAELRRLQAALATAERDGDGIAQGRLHGEIEAVDGYRAPARAARLMRGLGFAATDEARGVREFSGGWRVRLGLAQALMCRSDLLLLDEPTNHLDLDAIIWMERWLRDYSGTLMLISHDRDFMDPVVDRIARLENGRVRLYSGNYSAYERQYAEELASQQARYERQQREAAHMRRFVERFRYKASKARQAQSRLKALARLEDIAPAHVDAPFHFRFEPPDKLPAPIVDLEDASVGYAATPVVEHVTLRLSPGARVGLLGANGAGKSTLVKLVAGRLAPMEGRREASPALALGYFDQHQVEQLDPEVTPIRALLAQAPGWREQQARNHLGGFGFSGERVDEPVRHFSGGEKARLTLALIVQSRPNLLLLDEPTNHLDLEMRHALGVALQEFEGAIVVVSHDRHLLRIVADEFWLVENRRVAPFDGDLDDYARHLLRTRNEDHRAGREAATADPARPDARMRRQANAERRAALRPIAGRVEAAERELSRLGRRRQVLEQRLADPAIYESADKADLQSLLREQGQVRHAIEACEADWLAATEALEAASAGISAVKLD